MHTYVVLRGIKDKLHRWIEDMEKVMVPFVHDGRPAMLQLAMRPVYIYELVYPEPAHEQVMKIIYPTESMDPTFHDGKTKQDKTAKKFGNRLNWIVERLRKFLKLEKVQIPPMEPNAAMAYAVSKSPYRQFIGIHPIGSKKDKKEIIELINEKV